MCMLLSLSLTNKITKREEAKHIAKKKRPTRLSTQPKLIITLVKINAFLL